MTTFTFNCPSCQQNLEVEEKGVGLEIPCPNCTFLITVPAPQTQEPEPIRIRKCLTCGQDASESASFCASCGADLGQEKKTPPIMEQTDAGAASAPSKTDETRSASRAKSKYVAAHAVVAVVIAVWGLVKFMTGDPTVLVATSAALPSDLVAVPKASYAALDGLAEGSQEAQDQQKLAVTKLGLSLEVKSKEVGIAFRLIPAGSFTMGTPMSEDGRNDDEVEHVVKLSKGFYCGKFEVTQGEWKAVMGGNPSKFKEVGPKAPVENVTWNNCQTFLEKLCSKEGVAKGTYRLLSEAEWEFACRSGTRSANCFGDSLNSSQVNFDGNQPYGGAAAGKNLNKTKSVGSYAANGWGLFDMHGNVYEWCNDGRGKDRVHRGGSWGYPGRACRSGFRHRNSPSKRNHFLGFRLMRSLPEK